MKILMTELICPCCGEIVSIQRKADKSKTIGHIKDMYCPYCKDDRKFIEIIDKDICYSKLLYKSNLNDIEKLILELLENRKEKNKTYGK